MSNYDWASLWLTVKIQFPGQAAEYEQIILRWLHFAAGTTWVGLLYFFNLVNVPFQKQLDGPTKGKVVPLLMPRALWWFRWAAVVTVLAGFRYFMILAKTDADNAGRPGLMWQWLGMWFVVWTVAWLLVYLLIKFAKGPLKDGRVLAIPIALVIVLASWAILKFTSDPGAGNRTLAISVGGGMGWVMLLNVWGVIWRYQKKIIAWTKSNADNGTTMPAEAAGLARLGFLTSRANFWLSFPMLFFMAASAHFAFLSGQ